MPRQPLNIEELIQRLSAEEPACDVEHRYELRRSLLCSRFFEPRVSRWDRMMTYTAPLFVGGMMVGVFTLMATNMSVEPDVGPQTLSKSEIAATPSVDGTFQQIRVEDFLSDPDLPTVALAGFESTNEERVLYTPLRSETHVRTQ